MTGYAKLKLRGLNQALRYQRSQQSAFSLKDLAINGNDLINLGLKPGPEFSEYLQSCLDAVIDGVCENTYESLLTFLEDSVLNIEIDDLEL